jgi:hypothetical protein
VKAKPVYSDNLIDITDEEIVFKHYYFPFGKSKTVALADIERITVERAALLSGKWRLWGTGDFTTWFPMDFKRPTRDRIFFAALRSQRVGIGFTAEIGDDVERTLRERGLIRRESTSAN